MAKRPIYLPLYSGDLLVKTIFLDFTWFPGMAPSQKIKSVKSLHDAALESGICSNPLEVSSKSTIELGVALSAFNLKVVTEKQRREFTVESAYQASKKFARGGPYKDLMYRSSIAAKKDPRLRESGSLIGFEFFGQIWELEPKTAFYDWLYINALRKNFWAIEKLEGYDGFTDIEFNPEKSINCQAYSVALFKSLSGRNLLNDALSDRESYLSSISSSPINNARENTYLQPRLV